VTFALLSERTSITPYSAAALAGRRHRLFPAGLNSRSGAGWRTPPPGGRPSTSAYTAGVLAFSGVLVLASKYSPFLYFRF
jgi:hypothetical protein